MAMMVIIGSRLLGHVSLVGIEYSHVAAKKRAVRIMVAHCGLGHSNVSFENVRWVTHSFY